MQLGYRKLDFLFLWVSFVLFCISSWTYFLVHPKGELINELKTIVSRVLPTIISTTHSRISEISLKVSEIYVSVFCLLILTLWSSVSRCLKINSTSIHYSTLSLGTHVVSLAILPFESGDEWLTVGRCMSWI